MKATGLLALAIAPALASAWDITYYKNERCRGKPLHFLEVTAADSTCHRSTIPVNMKYQSVKISGLDRHHDYHSEHKIRFYDTEDCSSSCSDRHVIAEQEAAYSHCVSWPLASRDGRKMLSFNVEEYGDLGYMGWRGGAVSDGICKLEHGDEIFARGRAWKMQQVAATWFNEILAEEWDPAVHARNTTIRFGKHGDVDIYGQYKMQESYRYMEKIEFDFWDEEKHIPIKDRTDEPGFFNGLVKELCRDATLKTVDRARLLEKIPNVDELCEGWVDGKYMADISSKEQSIML